MTGNSARQGSWVSSLIRERSRGFQFWPNDWLGSATVRQMSFAEEGLYLRLLAASWQYVGLPEDRAEVEALIEKPIPDELLPVLEELFPATDEPPYECLREDHEQHGGRRRYCILGRLERQRERSRSGRMASRGSFSKLAGGYSSKQPAAKPAAKLAAQPPAQPWERERERERVNSGSGGESERGGRCWLDPLPEHLATPDVRAAAEEWQTVRQRKRCANTQAAKARALAALERLSAGHAPTAVAILQQSADAGWAKLWPLKESMAGRRDPAEYARETLQRTMERLVDDDD